MASTGPSYSDSNGRVIEHLGIQMYQSPVNAVAELIANARDADATVVAISLPTIAVDGGAELIVNDNGVGMTFEEFQEHYLQVGRNRRGNDPEELTDGLKRPVLGRKGIGKFAGFGIARTMVVETVSRRTGERTAFRMGLEELLGVEYIGTEGKQIEVISYDGPDEDRREHSGTVLHLSDLTIRRAPNADDGLSVERVTRLVRDTDRYAWVQHLMLLEHRARTAIVKNALDHHLTDATARGE